MGGLTVRLNAIQRLDLQEAVVDLAARAIVLRHPRADVLAGLSVTKLGEYSDEVLADALLRLQTWIADQEEAAAVAREGADG